MVLRLTARLGRAGRVAGRLGCARILVPGIWRRRTRTHPSEIGFSVQRLLEIPHDLRLLLALPLRGSRQALLLLWRQLADRLSDVRQLLRSHFVEIHCARVAAGRAGSCGPDAWAGVAELQL